MSIEDGAASRALRERSPETLRDGLLAYVSETAGQDYRDVLMALAPFHHCAERLGVDRVALFDEAARSAPPELRSEIGAFGRRTDIDPAGWGFRVEETPDGPRYAVAPRPFPSHDETAAMLDALGIDPPPDWRSRVPDGGAGP